jgi:hypothetical protein
VVLDVGNRGSWAWAFCLYHACSVYLMQRVVPCMWVLGKTHDTQYQATLTFSINNLSTKFSFPKCASIPSISFCICEKRPCRTLRVYARLSVFSNSSRISFLASGVVLPVARRCWRRLGRRTLPLGAACDCDFWRLWISGSENLPSSRSSQKPFWEAY